MNIEKNYKTALKSAYEGGAEMVANPGNPDCGIMNARKAFAFYAGVEKFNDLTDNQKSDFYCEWSKGVSDEKEACGLS